MLISEQCDSNELLQCWQGSRSEINATLVALRRYILSWMAERVLILQSVMAELQLLDKIIDTFFSSLGKL